MNVVPLDSGPLPPERNGVCSVWSGEEGRGGGGRRWKDAEKAEERKGAGSATARITGTRDLSALLHGV